MRFRKHPGAVRLDPREFQDLPTDPRAGPRPLGKPGKYPAVRVPNESDTYLLIRAYECGRKQNAPVPTRTTHHVHRCHCRRNTAPSQPPFFYAPEAVLHVGASAKKGTRKRRGHPLGADGTRNACRGTRIPSRPQMHSSSRGAPFLSGASLLRRVLPVYPQKPQSEKPATGRMPWPRLLRIVVSWQIQTGVTTILDSNAFTAGNPFSGGNYLK